MEYSHVVCKEKLMLKNQRTSCLRATNYTIVVKKMPSVGELLFQGFVSQALSKTSNAPSGLP